ncbi:hypothetical protein ACA910_004086 [Epithemia clementina (nom. ined.)]
MVRSVLLILEYLFVVWLLLLPAWQTTRSSSSSSSLLIFQAFAATSLVVAHAFQVSQTNGGGGFHHPPRIRPLQQQQQNRWHSSSSFSPLLPRVVSRQRPRPQSTVVTFYYNKNYEDGDNGYSRVPAPRLVQQALWKSSSSSQSSSAPFGGGRQRRRRRRRNDEVPENGPPPSSYPRVVDPRLAQLRSELSQIEDALTLMEHKDFFKDQMLQERMLKTLVAKAAAAQARKEAALQQREKEKERRYAKTKRGPYISTRDEGATSSIAWQYPSPKKEPPPPPPPKQSRGFPFNWNQYPLAMTPKRPRTRPTLETLRVANCVSRAQVWQELSLFWHDLNRLLAELELYFRQLSNKKVNINNDFDDEEDDDFDYYDNDDEEEDEEEEEPLFPFNDKKTPILLEKENIQLTLEIYKRARKSIGRLLEIQRKLASMERKSEQAVPVPDAIEVARFLDSVTNDLAQAIAVASETQRSCVVVVSDVVQVLNDATECIDPGDMVRFVEVTTGNITQAARFVAQTTSNFTQAVSYTTGNISQAIATTAEKVDRIASSIRAPAQALVQQMQELRTMGYARSGRYNSLINNVPSSSHEEDEEGMDSSWGENGNYDDQNLPSQSWDNMNRATSPWLMDPKPSRVVKFQQEGEGNNNIDDDDDDANPDYGYATATPKIKDIIRETPKKPFFANPEIPATTARRDSKYPVVQSQPLVDPANSQASPPPTSSTYIPNGRWEPPAPFIRTTAPVDNDNPFLGNAVVPPKMPFTPTETLDNVPLDPNFDAASTFNSNPFTSKIPEAPFIRTLPNNNNQVNSQGPAPFTRPMADTDKSFKVPEVPFTRPMAENNNPFNKLQGAPFSRPMDNNNNPLPEAPFTRPMDVNNNPFTKVPEAPFAKPFAPPSPVRNAFDQESNESNQFTSLPMPPKPRFVTDEIETDEGPPPPIRDGEERITVCVKDHTGAQNYYQIKLGTIMKRVMEMHAIQKGVAPESLRYSLDRSGPVMPYETGLTLGLYDGDEINCFTNSGQTIAIRVQDHIGSGISLFEIPTSTEMSVLFDMYASRKGMEAEGLRFVMAGNRDIEPWMTPEMLGLSIGDLILCCSDNAPVTIRIQDESGEQLFRIKKSTKMSKLFDMYADGKGVLTESLRFMMEDGRDIEPSQTPLTLKLEEGGTIRCTNSGELIFLQVRDPVGADSFFRIRRSTRMSKLFEMYAQMKGVKVHSLHFTLENGTDIDPANSPHSLRLKDEDRIYCVHGATNRNQKRQTKAVSSPSPPSINAGSPRSSTTEMPSPTTMPGFDWKEDNSDWSSKRSVEGQGPSASPGPFAIGPYSVSSPLSENEISDRTFKPYARSTKHEFQSTRVGKDSLDSSSASFDNRGVPNPSEAVEKIEMLRKRVEQMRDEKIKRKTELQRKVDNDFKTFEELQGFMVSDSDGGVESDPSNLQGQSRPSQLPITDVFGTNSLSSPRAQSKLEENKNKGFTQFSAEGTFESVEGPDTYASLDPFSFGPFAFSDKLEPPASSVPNKSSAKEPSSDFVSTNGIRNDFVWEDSSRFVNERRKKAASDDSHSINVGKTMPGAPDPSDTAKRSDTLKPRVEQMREVKDNRKTEFQRMINGVYQTTEELKAFVPDSETRDDNGDESTSNVPVDEQSDSRDLPQVRSMTKTSSVSTSFKNPAFPNNSNYARPFSSENPKASEHGRDLAEPSGLDLNERSRMPTRVSYENMHDRDLSPPFRGDLSSSPGPNGVRHFDVAEPQQDANFENRQSHETLQSPTVGNDSFSESPRPLSQDKLSETSSEGPENRPDHAKPAESVEDRYLRLGRKYKSQADGPSQTGRPLALNSGKSKSQLQNGEEIPVRTTPADSEKYENINASSKQADQNWSDEKSWQSYESDQGQEVNTEQEYDGDREGRYHFDPFSIGQFNVSELGQTARAMSHNKMSKENSFPDVQSRKDINHLTDSSSKEVSRKTAMHGFAESHNAKVSNPVSAVPSDAVARIEALEKLVERLMQEKTQARVAMDDSVAKSSSNPKPDSRLTKTKPLLSSPDFPMEAKKPSSLSPLYEKKGSERNALTSSQGKSSLYHLTAGQRGVRNVQRRGTTSSPLGRYSIGPFAATELEANAQALSRIRNSQRLSTDNWNQNNRIISTPSASFQAPNSTKLSVGDRRTPPAAQNEPDSVARLQALEELVEQMLQEKREGLS